MLKDLAPKFFVVNDICGGTMGERTIWNFLLEGLPNSVAVDFRTTSSNRVRFELDARNYIHSQLNSSNGLGVIIQNASFIGKVSNEIPTICLLQDNLREMYGRDYVQEYVLKTSESVVFNSQLVRESYPDIGGTVIPLGLDSVLFKIHNKAEMRIRHSIPSNSLVAVFVGAFNDVKGWQEVLQVCEHAMRDGIYLIAVTKEEGICAATFGFPGRIYQRIPQDTLSELLGAADFFILGSPVETQCLAALEAGLCNVPILMKRTGIFMDMEQDVQDRIGVFDDDLGRGYEKLVKDRRLSGFQPRDSILAIGFSIMTMIELWRKEIDRVTSWPRLFY